MKRGLPFVFALNLLAQSPWQISQSGTTVALRGLSVVNGQVAWASGAKGTVLRTVDGEHWKIMQVPGAEGLDFRDVEGFSENVAIAMSAGPGYASTIYKTTDGGATWSLKIRNPDPMGFWDAMAFWDAHHGMVFGDPVKGRFQTLITKDGGDTWTSIQGPESLPNEGGFAASGTCLTVSGTQDVWIATGGAKTSRVLHSSNRGKSWTAAEVPVFSDAPTKGLFSIAFRNAIEGFAVGGDYKKPMADGPNGSFSLDGGKSWKAAPGLPLGFFSVVVAVPHTKGAYVAAGPLGSTYSTDGGHSWTPLDQSPVNTVGFADPNHGWAVGPKGLVLKYVGKALK